MWRSFFYALGVGLMVLGGEALIFERVTLDPDSKLPSLAQRLLESSGTTLNFSQRNEDQYQYAFGGGGSESGIPNSVNANGGQFRQIIPTSSNGGRGYANQSRFGPSRFAGPANGGYGGGRVRFGQYSAFETPQQGRSKTSAQLASTSNAVNSQVAGGPKSPRKQIITKDWMPWSLIAVGAVVFLYTHTSRER